MTPESALPPLETPRDVIAALGGISIVAKITDRRPGTVSAWQTWMGYFPPNTYAAMTDALARIGRTAPRHLWKMTEAAE